VNNYATRVFTFGPGSMEALTLRVWAHRRISDKLQARLTGSFSIYCGLGNEHTVAIDERFSGYVVEGNAEAWLGDAFRGIQGAADNLAAQMVEWALDGWIDPCDDEHGSEFIEPDAEMRAHMEEE